MINAELIAELRNLCINWIVLAILGKFHIVIHMCHDVSVSDLCIDTLYDVIIYVKILKQ